MVVENSGEGKTFQDTLPELDFGGRSVILRVGVGDCAIERELKEAQGAQKKKFEAEEHWIWQCRYFTSPAVRTCRLPKA